MLSAAGGFFVKIHPMSEISCYTEEGLNNLKKEIKNLESVERPKISQQVQKQEIKEIFQKMQNTMLLKKNRHAEARISKLKIN